jgi:hypothetical protein
MQKAMVCTENTNMAAFKTISGGGFKPLKVLWTYIKNYTIKILMVDQVIIMETNTITTTDEITTMNTQKG